MSVASGAGGDKSSVSTASSRRPPPTGSSQKPPQKSKPNSPPETAISPPDSAPKSAQPTQRQQVKSAQPTERQKSRPPTPPEISKEELDLLDYEIKSVESKSAVTSARPDPRSALTSGRLEPGQKSSVNTERPDPRSALTSGRLEPGQKSSVNTERPDPRSALTSGRLEPGQKSSVNTERPDGKSNLNTERPDGKSTLNTERPDPSQKSALTTERPDPSQKSALTTERPDQKSQLATERSGQNIDEQASRQPSKPASPSEQKSGAVSVQASRRASQQEDLEKDQPSSPNKQQNGTQQQSRVTTAQKQQQNEDGERKTTPQKIENVPTPSNLAGPTPSLPPLTSPPRNENAAPFNQGNADPLASSLPPTPPTKAPQQINEAPQINKKPPLNSMLKDDAPLPRRKSRAPFGERLSLVQYNNPEPVPPDQQSEIADVDPVEELKRIANCSLPPIEPEKQLRCIMDCILPPRKREIDGQSWLERASTVPSTRLDILGLQQRFETELNVAHAKSFGICPIRRRIYDEMFDELIRQVTINCAERGLLLLRVRDEIHLSMLSYQTLLESAIGYGIRKAIVFEQQQSQALLDRDLEKAKNMELTKKVEELEKQLRQEAVIREEEVKLLEATMKDENERLVESNRTLKMHLQAILQMDQQLQVQQATLNDASVKEN